MHAAIDAFLLGFPALFSIVNPVSGAFIFRIRTAERTHGERVVLARKVAVYAGWVLCPGVLRHYAAGAALRWRPGSRPLRLGDAQLAGAP